MIRTSVVLVVLLALAGCSGGATTPAPSVGPSASPAIEHPAGANDVVLRYGWDGGLVAPGAILTRLPVFTVYGDGRVITQGPQVALYPGPALPNLLVSRVSEGGLQRILAAARDAGLLGPDARFPYPGVADATTTTFVVHAGGAVHSVSAYALGVDQDTAEITPAEAEARAKLSAFVDRSSDLDGWLGADVVAADAPFAFERLRVFATPGEPTLPDGQIAPTVVDWPLPEPLASAGTALGGIGGAHTRCILLAADDLATVRPMLETASQLTYVRSGGATFAIALRPLLPDEHGCPTT